MRDSLSMAMVLAGMGWFALRTRAIHARAAAGAVDFLELRAELETAYMRGCILSVLWFLPAVAFRLHGGTFGCLAIQMSWAAALFFLYLRCNRFLREGISVREPSRVKAQSRFWGALVVFFVGSSYAAKLFDSVVLGAASRALGWSFYGTGAGILVSALLFGVEMLVFLFLSPWLFRCAFGSRREEDPAVLALVREVFRRAGLPPPVAVRVDTGRAYFAAVTGLRLEAFGWEPTLFLSDSLVSGLDREELEAVIAHELVHVRRSHLRKRVLWFMGLFGLYSCYCFAVALAIPSRLFSSGWLDWDSTVLISLALSLIGFVGLFWALRKVVRHQETEADAYAVAHFGATAGALVSALDKILAVAKRSRTKQSPLSWVIPAAAHPTVAEREQILARAERRSRRGRDALRKHERPFFVRGFLARSARAAFLAACVWMVPTALLEIQRREATEGLRASIAKGDLAGARYLLACGATARDGAAFVAAVEKGDVEAVALLLSLGASPDWRGLDGNGSFELAWKRGHKRLAAYLDSVSGTQRPEARAPKRTPRRLAGEPAQEQ